MIYVFTAAAANYLPKVKLLCSSLRRYHPEFVLYLALANEIPEGFNVNDESFDGVITIRDLDIPKKRSWIFRHSLVELCTGMKPFMLRYLLGKQDCEAVLYFDPDIVVFSRLDDLLEGLKLNTILLTPHQTKPEQTLEAVFDNEVCSLRHGIYNLGFIGVKNNEEGQNFSEWWSKRLYYFCSEDLERGFWVDQKWIDFAPVFFEGIKILKSPRFNVAPWNLTTRKLEGNFEKGFMVDDQPLGFYHFTGFDCGDHEIMATKYAGNNTAVRALIKWYKQKMANDKKAMKMPWDFATFENGMPITRLHRVIYRMRQDLQDTYPDPFKVVKGGKCYYNWFRSRAKIEHPGLFKGVTHDQVLFVVRMPHRNQINWGALWQYVRLAFSDYRLAIQLLRKAVVVFRQEGIRGLKRHLS